MIRVAERMRRLGTETAFEVLSKARALEAQGKHIIHLEIGEPDFDTPANIKQAAKKALDDGFTHYGPAAGLAQARAAIARHVSRTGGILRKSDLVKIAEIARAHDLLVLSDEIYGRIMYDGLEHFSIASLPGMQERTVILDGFSKSFAMTGWRLGYGVMPGELVKLV